MRRRRIRDGIRRVKITLVHGYTVGVVGGWDMVEQTHTSGWGFPCTSNDTHVQPVSTSCWIATQYFSIVSRFRRLHVGRNCRPGSNNRSWPAHNEDIRTSTFTYWLSRTKLRVAQNSVEVELLQGLSINKRMHRRDVKRIQVNGNRRDLNAAWNFTQ